MMKVQDDQKIICQLYSAPFLKSPLDAKAGVSKNVSEGTFPIHGLRHPAANDTCGWYIWVGEYSNDADFFSPIHIEHLNEIRPEIINYLGLAPGWRFLIADNYVDVWEDKSLLDITL